MTDLKSDAVLGGVISQLLKAERHVPTNEFRFVPSDRPSSIRTANNACIARHANVRNPEPRAPVNKADLEVTC